MIFQVLIFKFRVSDFHDLWNFGSLSSASLMYVYIYIYIYKYMYTIYYIRTYLKHIVVCIGSIGQTWKNIVLHLPNIIMQRDRDRETFLIHFTLIHRLALPGTTRSLTAMLLCMIAPGLDSSITAVSVRFFLIEASLVDSPWTQQSSPGTLLTTADSQTAGTFGASPVGLLPGAYFYAHYAAYVCMSRRCSMS